MTLDNMTGITKGSYTGDDLFCKSQLITCNRVKECNGVCPFEDALKHADQTAEEQNKIDHDREWIIGCIKHDGFIKTDRFDKANQIILEALDSTEPRDLISRFDAIDKAKEIIFPLLDEMDYDDTGSMVHVCISMKIKILDMLHALPSVSAERVGVWVKPKEHDHMRECSICEYEIPNDIAWESNYCPNCGAKMKGEDNER